MLWKKLNLIKTTAGFLGLLLLLGFTACSSLKTRSRAEDWLGVFPAESVLYLMVNNYTPFIEPLLANAGLELTPQLRQVLEKTVKIYAALQVTAGGQSEYRIILQGSYSYFLIHMALDLDSQWTAGGDPVLYYTHSSGLQLANPNWTTLLLTNGDISSLRADYFSRRTVSLQIPLLMRENTIASDFFCFFPDLAADVLPPHLPLNTRKLPISTTWITLEGGGGQLGGGFNLQSAEGARKFLTGFKSFLLWWLKEGGLTTGGVSGKIKGIEFEQSDGYLLFRNLELNQQEWSDCLAVILGSGAQK